MGDLLTVLPFVTGAAFVWLAWWLADLERRSVKIEDWIKARDAERDDGK